MKKEITRDITVSAGTVDLVESNYENATLFVADILKRNMDMVSELSPIAIKKYNITKIVNFYENKKFSNFDYVDIDIDKLTNDFVMLDKILCVDETYFYKQLNISIFGFNAISIPHTRSKETEERLKFTSDNISHYMLVLPDTVANLTKNLITIRLERGGL